MRRPVSRLIRASSSTRMARTLRDRPVELVKSGVQSLGLRDGAGEAVHEEALGGVGFLQPVLDDADDHAVGDQVAGVHVLLGFQAHGGLVLDRVAQDVAGGDVGDAVLGHDTAGLGALAGSGRAQQDEIELRSCAVPSLSLPALLEEALVVAHEQLGFHLLHGVERHTDDDQQRRAAEVEGHVEDPDEQWAAPRWPPGRGRPAR